MTSRRTNIGTTRRQSIRTPCLFVLALVVGPVFLAGVVAGQGPDDTAPPPVQIVQKVDLEKLGAEIDTKQRTQLAISIMNTRLTQAEQAFGRTDYEAMFQSFGEFHGLMNYSLDFLVKSDNSKAKSLDNFRKFELALKGYQNRLEMIHRELPLRWEEYTRKLVKFVRDGRAKALAPLFSDSVVPIKTR